MRRRLSFWHILEFFYIFITARSYAIALGIGPYVCPTDTKLRSEVNNDGIV